MNHPITPLTGNWGSLTPNHNQIKLTPICTIPTFSDSEALLISLKSSRMGWWVIYLLMARQTRPAVKKKVNRKPLRYISDPFCGRGSLPGFNDYNVFKEPFFFCEMNHTFVLGLQDAVDLYPLAQGWSFQNKAHPSLYVWKPCAAERGSLCYHEWCTNNADSCLLTIRNGQNRLYGCSTNGE